MRCKYCGRDMKKVVTPFRRPVKGETLVVQDIEVYRCPGCGAVYFPQETLKHTGRRVGEKLLEVAKERGRIDNISNYKSKLDDQKKMDLEDEIKRRKLKKKDGTPLKVFT